MVPSCSRAYSGSKLLHFLDATSGLPLPGDVPYYDFNAGRPLSFRALLAACDDESYGLPLTARWVAGAIVVGYCTWEPMPGQITDQALVKPSNL